MQPGAPPPSDDPRRQQPTGPDPAAPYGQEPTGDPYAQQGYGSPPPQGYGAPAQGYGAPPPGYGPPPPKQNNTLGLLGMIFGIVGIPAAFCAILGFLFGGAGVVLGALGLRNASQGRASNRGMAMAGVICGAIAVVLAIVSGVFGALSMNS